MTRSSRSLSLDCTIHNTNPPSSLIAFLDIPEIENDIATSNWTAFASAINETLIQIFETYPPTDFNTYDTVNASLTALQYSTTKEEAKATFLELFNAVQHSVYQTYGLEAPESEAGTLTATDQLQSDVNVIGLVFTYFFLAAGVTLILMGVLNVLTLPRSCFGRQGLKSLGLWGRIGIFFVVGAAIAGLVGLLNLPGDSAYNFSMSAWLLPVVVLGLAIVLVVQYVRWPWNTQGSGEKH